MIARVPRVLAVTADLTVNVDHLVNLVVAAVVLVPLVNVLVPLETVPAK